jgi:hypothetical protein
MTAAAVCAQSPGQIHGYAWSAEGRPIPEARITIRATETKTDQTVTAGKDGAFVAKDLKAGHYDIIAQSTKEQLATESITEVDVKSGEAAHADLTLGMSTVYHGYWSRLVRRLDGLH